MWDIYRLELNTTQEVVAPYPGLTARIVANEKHAHVSEFQARLVQNSYHPDQGIG